MHNPPIFAHVSRIKVARDQDDGRTHLYHFRSDGRAEWLHGHSSYGSASEAKAVYLDWKARRTT